MAELSTFCKSTSKNSTRLQRDPAKVFNCGGEVTSGGGVSVDICPLGCGAFRVWIQPTTEMIHSNIPTDVKVAHQFHLRMEPGRIFWDAPYSGYESWPSQWLHKFTLLCRPIPVPGPNVLNLFRLLLSLTNFLLYSPCLMVTSNNQKLF